MSVSRTLMTVILIWRPPRARTQFSAAAKSFRPRLRLLTRVDRRANQDTRRRRPPVRATRSRAGRHPSIARSAWQRPRWRRCPREAIHRWCGRPGSVQPRSSSQHPTGATEGQVHQRHDGRYIGVVRHGQVRSSDPCPLFGRGRGFHGPFRIGSAGMVDKEDPGAVR